VREPADDGLEIRRAQAADWNAIAALLAASSLPTAGAAEHLDGFVVAIRAGRIVGSGAVERYGSTGLLRSVAVAESERGRGTGSTLVEQCIAAATVAGLESLVLLTTTAEQYFPRFRFERIGRDAVPEGVQRSIEFREACPASATVMRLALATAPPRPAAWTIRPGRREDAPRIAAIYNAGIRERTATFETAERTAADIATWFASDRHPILVAEDERIVIGWIAAFAYRTRECYAGVAEFSVYVDEAARGRGVGDALMGEFLPALAARGFWKVLSRIFTENTASRALCTRHGFRDVGVYEKHARLDGIWRDVVIVERLLAPSASPAAPPEPA
jgi:phosphinothricin acetyltransferase